MTPPETVSDTSDKKPNRQLPVWFIEDGTLVAPGFAFRATFSYPWVVAGFATPKQHCPEQWVLPMDIYGNSLHQRLTVSAKREQLRAEYRVSEIADRDASVVLKLRKDLLRNVTNTAK